MWFRKKNTQIDILEKQEERLSGGGLGVRLNSNSDLALGGDRGIRSASASVSIADLIEYEAARRRYISSGGTAMAASGYTLPEDFDPNAEPDISERIRQRSTQTTVGGGNVQIPETDTADIRGTRSTQSLLYYLSDGVAHAAIDTLYQYVIGPGFDIDIVYDHDDLPPWFNSGDDSVSVVKRNYTGRASKNKDRNIFFGYLNYKANDLKDRLDLEEIAVAIAKDSLITGDAFAYRVDTIGLDTYLESWQNDQREFLENDVYKIDVLNPIAVTIETNEFNDLIKAEVSQLGGQGGSNNKTSIPDLTKLIRMKWGGAPYTVYGVPHLNSALTELALKASLIRAAKASADRFSIPIRMLKYGVMAPGQDGGPIASAAMRAEVVSALQVFNPANEILASPFHGDLKLIGAEGQVLDLASQIAECDRRIMMALGIPPNFLDSNYTSFATAKIQFSNMILKLRGLQLQVAKTIEDDILARWAEMRGYRTPTGDLIKFKVRWKRADLESDTEIIRLISTLAKIPNQTILSTKTIRETLGFNDETEEQNFAVQWEQEDALGKNDPNANPNADPNAPAPKDNNQDSQPKDNPPPEGN